MTQVALSETGELLIEFGYRRKMASRSSQIFCRKLNADWSGYIVLESKYSHPFHTVGVINQPLNKLMYDFVKKVVPPTPIKIRSLSFGPALFMLTPKNFFDQLVANPKRDISALPLPHVLTLDWIKEIDAFIQDNAHLLPAVEFALTYNTYFQSQRYCLPIAFLMLGEKSRLDDYVAKWISRRPPEGEVELYAKYIAHLEEHWPRLSGQFSRFLM
jgi:hypothetical protein